MAEKPSGPVKPPVLDLQARKPSPRTPSKPADAPKSNAEPTRPTPDPAARAAQAQPSSAPPPRPAPPRPTPSSAGFPMLAAAISAIAGAALAVLIVLGLATSGLLSGLLPQADDGASMRLTFAEEQVSEALVGFNALNRQVTDLQARLTAAITRSDNNVDLLATRQDDLETAMLELPMSAPTENPELDLTGIQTQIDQLGTRIEVLQNGASPDQADTLTTDLAELRASLAAVTQQVSALSLRVVAYGESLDHTNEALLSESAVITMLQSDLQALKTEPSLPSSDSQLLRLPLALSGLETALEGARPFATELQSLLALVPNLAASDALTAAAQIGLPAPGRIVTDFSRAVPVVMAARPTDPDASMMDNLWARAQALLAIRPTGETGDDPITDTLTRAEQALANRQFANAAEALAQLPEPMQQAVGETFASITLMAEAETLLSRARASVLAASTASVHPAAAEAAE